MGLLLLTAAVAATAQNVFSIKDTTVQKSDIANPVTLELALENTDAITALQFDLTFPKGLTLESNSVQLNNDRIMNEHELKMAAQNDSTWRFVIVSESNGNKPLVKNSGTLLSLPVQIGEGFTTGRLSMSNVVLTDRLGNGLSYSAELGQIFVQEKQKQNLQIYGLEQVVNANKAAAISWEPKDITPTPTVTYYTDAACTTEATDDARKAAGTFYAVVDFAGNEEVYALKDTFTLVVNNKKQISLGEKGTVLPTATTLLQGQPLSASILSGGKAVIALSETDTIPLPGTFAWKNGNELATTTGKYAIIFTPEDEANYAGSETTIQLDVIPVYDVLVNNPENGSISATGLSSNNRYAEGQTLFLKAIPAANYKFTQWSNGVTTDTTTWEVKTNGTISATFTPITHTVSFSVTGNGAFAVKTAAGEEIASGSQIQQGTELLVSLQPNDGNKLQSLTLNGNDFTSGKYILGQEDISFAVSFVEAPTEFPVVTAETQNGVVRLYKEDGTAIPSGTAMANNSTFKIMALPNAGYEVENVSVNNTAVTAESGIYTGTVNNKTTVAATFKAKDYQLTIASENGTVVVKDGSTSLSNNASIPYGSTLTIEQPTATDNNTHRFRTLVVNGRKIESFPYTWKVESDVNISALFEELTTIKDAYLINAVQTYRYNNQDKRYFLSLTQTRATDFNIAYSKEGDANFSGIPVKAGTYNLTVTRPADDIYKAYTSGSGYFDGKLVIEKSKIAVWVAPTGTGNGETGETSVPATVKTETNGNITTFTYTPNDADNYEPVVYYLSAAAAQTVTPGNAIWYDNSSEASTSALRSTRMTKAGESSEPVKGYVKVSNGGLPYIPENGNLSIPEGTKITLEAIPAEGYKFTSWSNGNAGSAIEVVVGVNTTLPTASFDLKGDLNAQLNTSSSTYTGKVQEVVINNVSNAQVGIYTNKECTHITELKNAGEYWISVYRPATATENEVRDTLAYSITQATPTVVAPTTMEIAADETLAQVQLLGGNAGTVPGSFSWKVATEQVKAGKNNYKAVFTSADPNYESVEVDVEVTGLSVTKTTDPDPENPENPGGDGDGDGDDNTDPDPEDPDKPTSIEEVASETLLVVRKGALEIHPASQVDVAVISINGQYLFKGKIESVTEVRLSHPGVYVVSFIKEGKAVSRKVRVL